MGLIRVGIAWAMYWVGDLLSKTIVNRALGNYFEWPYRFYNWLMVTASDIQGDDPRGPWGPVECGPNEHN